MSRIASTTKGGWFPFSPHHLPAVASLFAPAKQGTPANSSGRLLDPCAGEGEALATLAAALNLTPYANELDHDRAAACRKRFGITRAVQGDLMTLRTRHNAYVMQWCNPPYTQNKTGSERRREFEYLKHGWKWTQVGGYTLWVVYAHHVTERAARWLLAHSKQVDVYRVPGLHLDTYAQVVVVARKAAATHDADEQEVQALVTTCQNPDQLRELTAADEARYRLPPPARLRQFHFRPDTINPEDLLIAIEKYGAHQTATFQATITPAPPPPPLTPIVPPRGGQMGLILAAGLFDGLVLDLETGPTAVRGVTRMIEVETTPPEDRGVEAVGIRHTFEIRPQVTVTLLAKSGKVRSISGTDETLLVEFLKANREAFLAHLEANSQPLYDFTYDHLSDVFEGVFRNRRLPGRPTTGLFETQKHVTAAIYAALKTRKGVLLVGEMGIGKSGVGAAVASALHRKGQIDPGQIAVVMTPPHLVNKWVREAQDAIPGSHVEIVTDVDDTTTFMELAAANSTRLHVMILSRERAKLGEGWEPAIFERREYDTRWPAGQEAPAGMEDESRVITRIKLCCPECGDPIPTRKDLKGEASHSWLKKQPRTCYRCNSPLWQFKRRWSGPKQLKGNPDLPDRLTTFLKWQEDCKADIAALSRDRKNLSDIKPRRNPRYPIARLLRDRYADRVGIVIVDEIHETKAGSSDQGRAMQDLMLIARKAIGMTGTLFGGTASSVFWLEWAINPRMVSQYPLDGGRAPAINKFVRANGVMERVVEYKENESESGRYSGIRRCEYAPQEVPGISPRLVGELLDHTLWVGLKDLNFALPEYTEIPVGVALPDDVQREYTKKTDRLLDYVKQCKADGDSSFLSSYLQATLRYPSSCFRPKRVVHKKKEMIVDGERVEHHVATFKGFGEERVYPKEDELAKLVKEELAAGRRCAVFVAQTGTLDIQPRLEKLLKQVREAKPFILRSKSPKTDRRDSHVEKMVGKGHNVMITNPRLVMTGMDLLAWPTLIFFEPDYSLYVTSQAARRAWRIGQTHDCKVVYLFYEQTMEERAIALISKKQAAAALLSGDAEGGGLAQLAGGSNSLLAELAKSIAEDQQVVDVTALFKQKAELSEDFTSGWAATLTTPGAAHPETATGAQPDTRPESASPAAVQAAGATLYEQYRDIKRQFPTALVLIRSNGVSEAFGDDAETIARELALPLTHRTGAGEQRIPAVQLPHDRVEDAINQLVEKGHQVAACTPTGKQPPTDPPSQKTSKGKAAGGKWPARNGQNDQPPRNGKSSRQPKRASGPTHAHLVGKTFIDLEDREVTVTGPDPLFPRTHVRVNREGGEYSIPLEKILTYRPYPESASPGQLPSAPQPEAGEVNREQPALL